MFLQGSRERRSEVKTGYLTGYTIQERLVKGRLGKRGHQLRGRTYKMPPEARGSRVLVVVQIIAHDGEGARTDLTPDEFANYMVGDGKGQSGGVPEMFARDDEVPKEFAIDWLRRDRSVYDAGQPGHIKLSQAYCTHLLRKELPQEPRHYRSIVSFRPEDSSRMNLVEFTRELMERVELDLSQRLIWVGSAHYNTDHDHVHIGIRGLDAAWEPVFLSAPYMNKGLRWRAIALINEVLEPIHRVASAHG